VIVVAVTGAIALAGGVGAASASAPRADQDVSSATLASLKTTFDAAEAAPKFTAPGPAFKASSAFGKNIVAFPASSGVPYCASTATDLGSIGGELGINVTNVATTGDPTQYAQGASQALVKKAALAMLCAIQPSSLAPQLAALTKAGLPSVAGGLADTSVPAPKDVTAATGVPLDESSKLMADDAVLTNKGKPFHVLVLTAYDLYGAKNQTEAATNRLKALCGSSCPVTTINIPVADWATKTSGEVATALTKDPKITAVLALFDGMVPTMISAAEGAHRSSLHIYTYGAAPGVVKLISSTHGLVATDIGPGANWTAFAAMDQLLRAMTHTKVLAPSVEYPPVRAWTVANASTRTSASSYGTAYEAGYAKLWGLTGSAAKKVVGGNQP
jgi:ribose transport system substrate-binding protein